MNAATATLAILVTAAAFEGLCAGRGVRQYLERLQMPPRAPSFRTWIVVGIAYYLIYGFILYRLLSGIPSRLNSIATGLVVAILLINAVWNFLFFRRRSPSAAFWLSLPYGMLAIALFLCLVRLDPVAALVQLPYLFYLPFSLWWMRALIRLNGPVVRA